MGVVRGDGRIARSRVGIGEQDEILRALNVKGATIESVAKAFGRNYDTVALIRRKNLPTTALATAKIRNKAADLVDRVLEKAEVDQIIDILSRPNIGVLDPIMKGSGGNGMGVGIHVSVGTGSLAAMSETVEAAAITSADTPPLPEASVGGSMIKIGPTIMGEASKSPLSRVSRLPGT